MTNNYFQFKQFKVLQQIAAMKVGTDGVLLGAWAAVENASTILDVGTGTGLIALMLAQRSSAQIDAIDIEEGAIVDASFNFKESPWSNRLDAFQTSLQNYKPEKKYDLIVCNPPFFTNGVKSLKTGRSTARHSDALSFDELAKGVASLLEVKGTFNVILPIEAEREFRNAANNYRLFASKIVRVKPKPSKAFKRVIMEFQFEASTCTENEMVIETDVHHEYTPDFDRLLKDFYLKL